MEISTQQKTVNNNNIQKAAQSKRASFTIKLIYTF